MQALAHSILNWGKIYTYFHRRLQSVHVGSLHFVQIFLSHFKSFKKSVKTQFCLPISFLISDRGGNIYLMLWISSSTTTYGIQLTVARLPHQNGVVERKKRMLMECTQILVIDANIRLQNFGTKLSWQQTTLWIAVILEQSGNPHLTNGYSTKKHLFLTSTLWDVWPMFILLRNFEIN